MQIQSNSVQVHSKKIQDMFSNSLHPFAQRYARIFVSGHYLFQEAEQLSGNADQGKL